MPVRLTIQSESNPRRACRWSLPTTMSGTYFPVPTTRMPVRVRHRGRGRGRSLLIGSASGRDGAWAVGRDYMNDAAGNPRPARGPLPLGPAAEEPERAEDAPGGRVDPQVAVGRGQVEAADQGVRPVGVLEVPGIPLHVLQPGQEGDRVDGR